jgi:hypothetical protein
MVDLPTHHREDFSWPPTRTLTWPRTQLLLDEVPLIDGVNREYRLKLSYEVIDNSRKRELALALRLSRELLK